MSESDAVLGPPDLVLVSDALRKPESWPLRLEHASVSRESGYRVTTTGERVMAEKPQETEGIVKGGKREPVARDDEFPPPEGTQDTVDEEVERKPKGPRPL